MSQVGCEVMKYEVGVGLRHGGHVRQVVPHDSVGERERRRGPIGQMTHHQPICIINNIYRSPERKKETQYMHKYTHYNMHVNIHYYNLQPAHSHTVTYN